MKVIKVIKNEKAIGKNGKEYNKSFYAIEHDNGKITVINPVFKSGYSELDFVAEKRFEKKDAD